MTVPIVLAAFGTTSRALKTYATINERVAERFPGHDIRWAYTSRMVKDAVKKSRNMDRNKDWLHPHEVMADLKAQGHAWAVVQSLHLVCGHEFYRLVDEVGDGPVRASMGLPLLSAPDDYQGVAHIIRGSFLSRGEEAVLLVGHGTDHPCWTSYIALDHLCRQQNGNPLFFGVVEGYPGIEETLEAVVRSGLKKVHLVPFMLVAGVHFKEDLAGETDSWKSAFEAAGIQVTLESEGLGKKTDIIDIFCHHIQDALDVIPTAG